MAIKKVSLPKKYLNYLNSARVFEQRCLNGKRWGGNPLLIIVDSALDSAGLSYFNIVVPRVKKFKTAFIDTGRATSLSDFAKYSAENPELLSLFNSRRIWAAAIKMADEFNKMRKNDEPPLVVMRKWAEEADYRKWHEDVIGKINGVGLITFQYLRMQLGVDTCMPDRIIKKFSKIHFGLETEDNMQFIEDFAKLCENLGVTQILLSWLIWLAESDKVDQT
ncbi:MAG: hypothetical protein ACTSQY_02185 [Candidatus Odinarchaeia archaeon]